MSYEYLVNDQDVKNTRILPYWLISGFFISVCMISYLLFPMKTLSKQVLASDEPQEITLYYLEKLVALEPHVAEFHQALAQQYIWKGDWSDANKQIKLLESEPAYNTETKLLYFQVKLGEVYAMKPSVQRQENFNLLKNDLKKLLLLPLNQAQQLNLAKIALGLDAPDIALGIYQNVLKNDTAKDPKLYRKIALIALQTKQYQISATYYFQAMDYEKEIEAKRRDLVNGLDVLVQGGLSTQGVDFVLKLPEKLLNNKALLEFLTQFMLAANRPDLAQIYIKRALLMGALS